MAHSTVGVYLTCDVFVDLQTRILRANIFDPLSAWIPVERVISRVSGTIRTTGLVRAGLFSLSEWLNSEAGCGNKQRLAAILQGVCAYKACFLLKSTAKRFVHLKTFGISSKNNDDLELAYAQSNAGKDSKNDYYLPIIFYFQMSFRSQKLSTPSHTMHSV